MAHQTYIRDSKGSDTAVLFIHGFLGSTEHFEKFIEIMPEDMAVYNILLKGHGGTVREFSKASMKIWKNQIDDVFCDILGKYKNVHIVGHSMGTFFAMEQSIKYPENVKSIILLQSPLKIGVKPIAFVNTVKSLFNLVSDDDETGKAYLNSHSIKLTMRFWEYIGWIPRYVELFCESKKARDTIKNVNVDCNIFQSEKDELVSMKSVKFIPDKENIKLNVMKKSAHFIYDKNDMDLVLEKFKNVINCD